MTTITFNTEELAIITSALHWRNHYHAYRIEKLERKLLSGKASDPETAERSLLERKRYQNLRADLELKIKMAAGSAYRGDRENNYRTTETYNIE